MSTNMGEKNLWWGYKHVSGTLQAPGALGWPINYFQESFFYL